MGAPLRDCTTAERSAVVRFIWAMRVKAAKVLNRKLTHRGSENSMTELTFSERAERFKATRKIDQPRPGLPSAPCTHAHVDRAEVFITEHRWIMSPARAAQLDTSYWPAHGTAYDSLGAVKCRQKKLAPKQLTGEARDPVSEAS